MWENPVQPLGCAPKDHHSQSVSVREIFQAPMFQRSEHIVVENRYRSRCERMILAQRVVLGEISMPLGAPKFDAARFSGSLAIRARSCWVFIFTLEVRCTYLRGRYLLAMISTMLTFLTSCPTVRIWASNP
jgi:hypothetical protein